MKKKRILIPLAIVIGLQVGLWIAGEKDGPLSSVPRMIAMDIEEARQHYETRGGRPPENAAPETLVLCPDLDQALGPEGLARLQAMMQPLGKSVILEVDAPGDWIADNITKPGFTKLCAEIAWQTPIVAQVEVVYWNGPLGAGGAGHRTWFLFGFWVPSGANSAWVS